MSLRTLAFCLSLLAAYIGLVLVSGTLGDWQPEEKVKLEPYQQASQQEIGDSVLSFTTWNLGYGGLGEESDFFYDHGNMFFSAGRMVRPPRALADKNIAGDTLFARSARSDFFLFQEVDFKAKRSYYINQFKGIQSVLPEYCAYFAPNYKASRVPIPLMEPWKAYGEVLSGLGTYARFQPIESVRLQLPGAFSWPTRIFQLDRCVSLHRFAVAGGKQLVVANIHLSAYDADGVLKKEQMAFLRGLILEEYDKGHYVVIGGDWNLCPPYFRFDGFMPGNSQGYSQINISPDWAPEGWHWAYDPALPSNRKIRTPYKAGETFVTTIDFFLTSPNIRLRAIKGIDQQFRYSDHQPVWMEVELL
ncbi:MAG: endonuclease/exonuclease/phosphatase family protein [Phaeodactylibacter sp.]|nr:endonuclease/exonuclease/phosphatase family protein [Phaeodactylibacter sp.]MCB9275823.1 endonuclease/exonuclease/phosphatase family protein [Lewinellaceae bacterium]